MKPAYFSCLLIAVGVSTAALGRGDDPPANLADYERSFKSVEREHWAFQPVRRPGVPLPAGGAVTEQWSGLLDETLVVWTGEFGRTPTGQNGKGCDHSPRGFSTWMAGGGIRGGQAYGATDDFGYKAVENPAHVNDLHATIVHLMGFDHELLTYFHAGRDQRLTNVGGRVIEQIVA